MRRTSSLALAACAVVVSMTACADPDFVPPKQGGSKKASAGASSGGGGSGLAGRAGNGVGGSNAAAGSAGAILGGAAGIAGAAGLAGAGAAGASGSSAGAPGAAGSAGGAGAGGGTAGSAGAGASGGTGSAGIGGASGSAGATGGGGGASGGGASGGAGSTAGASGSSGAAGGGGKAGGAGQAGGSAGSAGSATCVAKAEVCDGKDNDCDGPSDEAVLPLDGGTQEHPRGACVKFTSSTGADGFPLSFAITAGDNDLGPQPRELYYSLVFGVDATGPFVDATVVIREPAKDNTTLVGTARVVLGGSAKTKAVLAKNVTGPASFGIAKSLVSLGTHAPGDNQTHDYMIPLENVFDGASYTSINPLVLRVVGQIAPNTGPGGDATRIIVPGKSVGVELSP